MEPEADALPRRYHPTMNVIHVIEYSGRAAALVMGDEAIVADRLRGEERRIVAAKCLFATEINAGHRPGPYDDADAECWARTVISRRQSRCRR